MDSRNKKMPLLGVTFPQPVFKKLDEQKIARVAAMINNEKLPEILELY